MNVVNDTSIFAQIIQAAREAIKNNEVISYIEVTPEEMRELIKNHNAKIAFDSHYSAMTNKWKLHSFGRISVEHNEDAEEEIQIPAKVYMGDVKIIVV